MFVPVVAAAFFTLPFTGRTTRIWSFEPQEPLAHRLMQDPDYQFLPSTVQIAAASEGYILRSTVPNPISTLVPEKVARVEEA